MAPKFKFLAILAPPQGVPRGTKNAQRNENVLGFLHNFVHDV